MILGADTETHFGYARLLCIESQEPKLWSKPGDWRAIHENLLNINSPLAFYNLRFDVEAILKHYPEKLIRRLLYLGRIEFQYKGKRYEYRLIPWKLFSIKETRQEHVGNGQFRNRKIREFLAYDCAQFYHCSLQKAAESVLGKSKTEDKEFAIELNESMRPWKEELARIIEYCQEDANLCGELIRRFMQGAASDPINLETDRPFSCAAYAKLLMKQCIPQYNEVKAIHSKSSNRFYGRPWNKYDNVGVQSYFGGRFDIHQKGTFEKVWNADINSAYPHWIRQLPNPFNLHFVRDKEPEGEFSMVRALVSVPKDSPIPPLPYRNGGDIIYPVGTWEGWFHFHELKNAEKFGCEWDSIKALNGFEPNGKERPYEKRILEFYSQRKEWKKNNDPRQLAAKISMNSIYGVLYEKNERIAESDSKNATEFDGNHITKKKDVPGRYFHPFLAGWITSKTRVQLLNASPREGLIFQATDGILSEKKPNVECSEELGDWSLAKINSAQVFGVGIYVLDGVVKRRGLSKDKDKDPRPLSERMRVNEKGEILISVIEKGPIHLPTIFKRNKYEIKDALTWIETKKEVNITQCSKRIWPQFTLNDLLSGPIASQPRPVPKEGELNSNPGIVIQGDEENDRYTNRRWIESLGEIQ